MRSRLPSELKSPVIARIYVSDAQSKCCTFGLESTIARSEIREELSIRWTARCVGPAVAGLNRERIDLFVSIEVSLHQEIAVCGGKREWFDSKLE